MLTQQFYFFNTLLELHKQLPAEPRPDDPIFSAEFRDFLFQENGKTLETLQMMAPYFLRPTCRPFQLLYDDPDLYIVFDCTAYTYYACFRNLTMIDVDISPLSITDQEDEQKNDEKRAEHVLDSCSEYLKWLIQECEKHRDWRFAIFRSRNGLHVFPLHHSFTDALEERAEFQLSLKCDFYYALFCYLRHGCAIRLNPKPDEIADGQSIYQFVGFLGYGSTNPEILALVNLHIELTHLFHTPTPPTPEKK